MNGLWEFCEYVRMDIGNFVQCGICANVGRIPIGNSDYLAEMDVQNFPNLEVTIGETFSEKIQCYIKILYTNNDS